MVYLLLGTGFEETEAIAPLDLLRRANIPVLTVGINGKTVYGGHGIGIEADIIIDEMDLTDQIILKCHFKSRPYHTSDGVDGTVSPTIHLLHFNQPGFGIGLLHFVDTHLSEFFFFNNVDNEIIVRLGIVTHIDFQ